MLILPIETENHEADTLLVVLRPDNIKRMETADPAVIKTTQCGKNLVNPTVIICYEENVAELNRLIHGGNLSRIMKHLQRGWKFRPEQGDNDDGPQSIMESN